MHSSANRSFGSAGSHTKRPPLKKARKISEYSGSASETARQG